LAGLEKKGLTDLPDVSEKIGQVPNHKKCPVVEKQHSFIWKSGPTIPSFRPPDNS